MRADLESRTALVQSTFADSPERLGEVARSLDPGVDLVEVRADAWRGSADALTDAIAAIPVPVIATVRASFEGGRFAGSEAERAGLLQRLAKVAAYVDLEAAADFELSLPPSCRLILSRHNFEGTDRDLAGLAHRLQEFRRPAVVKLAMTPQNPADLAALVRLPGQVNFPIAAIGLGAAGLPTRVLGGRIGSALVYASTPGGLPTGPGQLSSTDLIHRYRLHRQGPDTLGFAVVGNPLGHSLSPLLHNAGFDELDLDRVFIPLEVPSFEDALELAAVLDLRGFSVTIPFKRDASRAAAGPIAGTDGAHEAIGAANTLLRDDSGEWHAANTDGSGFLQALHEGAPSLKLRGARALVLGAGGAARAAVFSLKSSGATVTVASRRRDRAEQLATELGAAESRDLDVDPRGFDLVVQCTPVGMYPEVDESPLRGARFGSEQVVLDMVYRPRRTRFLEQAERDGATVISGEEMFFAQAAQQFRWFSGRDAPLARWREEWKHAFEGDNR